MAAPTEPRNPFYIMLLAAGVIFIMTVLAYAVVPVLEQKAMDAGHHVPPRETSWFRNALHHDGWRWVLGEVAVLVILGLLCMGLDRYCRWKIENVTPVEKSDATEVESPPPA